MNRLILAGLCVAMTLTGAAVVIAQQQVPDAPARGFGTGITGLGIAWIVTTTLAIVAIRRGFIEQHREWMIRSYVVTFAFVTFRAMWTVLQAAEVGTLQEQLAMSSWFCWAVPLLIVETVLQGRRIFHAHRRHSVFDERASRSIA